MMVVATLETGTSSCFSHRDPGDREVDERTKAWPLTCNRDDYQEDARPERLSRAECSRKQEADIRTGRTKDCSSPRADRCVPHLSTHCRPFDFLDSGPPHRLQQRINMVLKLARVR